MAFFKGRSHNEDEDADRDDELTERQPPRQSLVPASARRPERQRLNIFTDEDDGQDLDFLKAIARQAETATPAAPSTSSAATGERAGDHLEVFRELAPAVERPKVMTTVRVPEIEMADLLDELSTMAAALRLRRAA